MLQAKMNQHALRPAPKGIAGRWELCHCSPITFHVFCEDDKKYWCRECNPHLTAGAEALAALVEEHRLGK